MQTQAFFFFAPRVPLQCNRPRSIAYSIGDREENWTKTGESVNQYVKLRKRTHTCAHTETQERVALAKRHFIVLEGVWDFSLFLLPVLDH